MENYSIAVLLYISIKLLNSYQYALLTSSSVYSSIFQNLLEYLSPCSSVSERILPLLSIPTIMNVPAIISFSTRLLPLSFNREHLF